VIDVRTVLQAIPHFETFCSVDKLYTLIDTLSYDSLGFSIYLAGTSSGGRPIHHIRYGQGTVKALLVAFPHPNEPVGGLTAFSLLTLLRDRHPALVEADVEWHIVPCIDPDGAILNEGWSQRPFSFDNYMRNFHRQEPRDQVEMSFPIKYKRLVFDQPVREAQILQRLLREIQPDFYYSLHNLAAGGAAFYCLSRDIDQRYYARLRELLKHHDMPLDRTGSIFGPWCPSFGEGMYELYSTRKFYDSLEATTSSPEEVLQHGACSFEYLAEIKEDALSFVAETAYVKHPSDGSKKETTENLRQLRLRMDAEYKFVTTVILEEWEKVKKDLDSQSPFYKRIFNGMVSVKDRLHDGLPSWPFKTRDILFNPAYSRPVTEGERFHIYQERLFLLCQSYEFVRLLKASAQTLQITQAVRRLESVFDEALADIARKIDFDAFEVVDCDTLAKVQLGSGLIVLNSLLESR
jgi:hypothetical protein